MEIDVEYLQCQKIRGISTYECSLVQVCVWLLAAKSPGKTTPAKAVAKKKKESSSEEDSSSDEEPKAKPKAAGKKLDFLLKTHFILVTLKLGLNPKWTNSLKLTLAIEKLELEIDSNSKLAYAYRNFFRVVSK